MTRLLLVGATGLVGGHVLDQALADPRVSAVVAPTRRALAPRPGLINPVVDFDRLPQDADWWAVDAVICTLGTTARKGGEFVYRRIDQGVVDTVVNGSGTFAEGSGQLLRRQQNGKVQFYGAYLFIGAALLAALIIAIA